MAIPKNLKLLLLLLQIYVFAWHVGARVELSMEEVVEVYREESAEIRCQYSFTETPSMMMVQWFVRGPGGVRQRISYSDPTLQKTDEGTEYTDRITVTGSNISESLLISDVNLSDEREFFCQVNGMAAGNGEGKTHLKVFVPPEVPVIEGVHTGVSVTSDIPSKIASCEVRHGYPKPNITWYRDRIPLVPTPGESNIVTLLTRESSGLYSVQSELHYKVEKEDRDAHFSCEVSYLVPGAVRTAESRSVNVTVHYPTTNVQIWQESPEDLVKEGDTVEIRCQGDGNPPPTFTFNREQTEEELEAGADSLVLTKVTRGNSGIYQCRALDMDTYDEVIGSLQLIVHYLDRAVVVPKDSEVMMKGESLTATCNALSSLETSTVWFKDGIEVGTGHSLFLQHATFEMAGEYFCEVTVPSLPGLQTSGSVHIIVQGAPQLNSAEGVVEMTQRVGRWLNLTCEARGYPQPSVSWAVTGSPSWREVVNRATEDSVQSIVTLKVISDTMVTCNATNDFGGDMKIYSITATPLVTSTLRKAAGEGSGVIIVVIIISILLLAILGSILYFLYKKGKLPCGRSGKQEIVNAYSTKEPTKKDDIVVEMKADKTEEAVLLKGVNGDRKPPNDQSTDVPK